MPTAQFTGFAGKLVAGMELRGSRVLLTGASSGLGPHIARLLHSEGAQLILSGRNVDRLETLATELAGAHFVPADLAEPAQVEALAAAAGQGNGVDVLISNAGLPASGALLDLSTAEIDRVLAVNLRAGIILTRLLLPAMLERRSGHVVFMASMAAHVAGARISLYNATKFGLRGFAEAMRLELHASGVGFSLVSPTYVREAGMWAETGVAAHPMAGDVPPAAVAGAVMRAIRRNRREIQVAPAATVISSRLAALAPGLAAAIARRTGASSTPPQVVARQRGKR